jgi:hypothetical protein
MIVKIEISLNKLVATIGIKLQSKLAIIMLRIYLLDNLNLLPLKFDVL